MFGFADDVTTHNGDEQYYDALSIKDHEMRGAKMYVKITWASGEVTGEPLEMITKENYQLLEKYTKLPRFNKKQVPKTLQNHLSKCKNDN